MADKKYSPIDPRMLNNNCGAESYCPPDETVTDCGDADCSGLFEFTTPAILYAGCTCDTDQLLNLYQVITDDEGEETECYIGTVRRSSPFQREFTITGKYRIKFCTDFCSPCDGADPEFYTSPLPDAAMATVDFEDRCNSTTNTIWRRTVQFYSPDPTQPDQTIQTVLSDVDTEIPCEDTKADIEHLERCDLDTKTLWFKSVYHTFDENGIPSPEIILKDWEDSGIKCLPDCRSYVADAIGEANPVFEPFNTFTIIKPTCCTLRITTSAGSFTMRKGEVSYQSDKFDCPLTAISVEVTDGDCLEDVHIVVNGN